MEPRRLRSPNRPGCARLSDVRVAVIRACSVLVLPLLLCALPGAAAAQTLGAPSLGDRGVGVEAGGGVALPAGGLAAVADPGFSAGVGASVPVAPNLNVRLDGGLDLPDRDVAAAPLINVYSGMASLEYVAQQEETGRAPLRTALSVGGGLSVVEAAEMPLAAPAGATFNEAYPTVTAGARLGYPVSSAFVVYLAPRVKWFDMPEEDWNRLTEGLGVAAPENGWAVPIRAGMRIGF